MQEQTRDPVSKSKDAGVKGGVWVLAFQLAGLLGLGPELAAYAATGVQLLGGYVGATLRDGHFLEPTDSTGVKKFLLVFGRNFIG